MKTLLDANAILRYLLGDVEEQSNASAEQIKAGCEVNIEVLAECVYVLSRVYSADRDAISIALIKFLDEVACTRAGVAKCALEIFAQKNLDFVDCVLLAESRVNSRRVFTFDKKLNRELMK